MCAGTDGVRAVTGPEFTLTRARRSAGFTDYQIGVRTFEVLGLTPEPDLVERLVRRYEELLPGSLHRIQGRVLPNVRAILETLRAERPDIRSYLLTGNTAAGARAKLTHYALADLISDGAFCIDATARAGIAVRALARAGADAPVDPAQAIVIGDTPHDIECARAVGARTLAVATGGYRLEELLEHAPWHGCAELPPPAEFLDLIGAGCTTSDQVPTG